MVSNSGKLRDRLSIYLYVGEVSNEDIGDFVSSLGVHEITEDVEYSSNVTIYFLPYFQRFIVLLHCHNLTFRSPAGGVRLWLRAAGDHLPGETLRSGTVPRRQVVAD